MRRFICIAGGWHTELGIESQAISGPLATLKSSFPNAKYLVFGWGAQDYYTAQNPGIEDLLRAVVPGPAVMLVVPLEVSPEISAGAADAFVLPISRDGLERLSEFFGTIWRRARKRYPPRRRRSLPAKRLFSLSTKTYDLTHTCNTWTAAALRVAGLPVSEAGVVFAGSGARSGSAGCRGNSSTRPEADGSVPQNSRPRGRSWDLVARRPLGDAAQRAALRHRAEPAGREQARRLRMRDDRPGRQDRARVGEPLHARGDIYRPAEVILAVVEHDRQARPLMDADLEQQIVAAVRPSLRSRIASRMRKCRGDRAIGCRKGRHHRVAGWS